MPKGIYEKSEEHKKKISMKLEGRKLSEETKERISKSMKGFHPKTEFKKGHQHSEDTKEKISIGNKKSHPILKPNGRRISTYRRILEKKIGRKLLPNEIVHHINGKVGDNRPENLEAMDSTKHNRMHGIKQWKKGDDKNG